MRLEPCRQEIVNYDQHHRTCAVERDHWKLRPAGLRMDWKQRLAGRCEIEIQGIQKLWDECEDILEWSDKKSALDGRHKLCGLVLSFRHQFFSFVAWNANAGALASYSQISTTPPTQLHNCLHVGRETLDSRHMTFHISQRILNDGPPDFINGMRIHS